VSTLHFTNLEVSFRLSIPSRSNPGFANHLPSDSALLSDHKCYVRMNFLSPTTKIRHSLFHNMTTDETISSCRSLHTRHNKPASNIIKKQCVRYCDNQSSTASSTLQESVETVIRHEITSDKSNITNISPQNDIRTRKSSRCVHYLLLFAQTK